MLSGMPSRGVYLSSSLYVDWARCCAQSDTWNIVVHSPNTPRPALFDASCQIPLCSTDSSGTFSGLFGFWFTSVRPVSQAPAAKARASTATALVILVVVIVVISLRPRADGETEA